MASGPNDPDHWKNDQIHSIVDLYKYIDQPDCGRALVGAWSYVHVQAVALQTWTVQHNLMTDDLVLLGYNAATLGNDMRDWTQVIIVDNNTLRVVWPAPRTGRFVVVSSGSRPNPNLELFLQHIGTHPAFFTVYTYNAAKNLVLKEHWSAPGMVIKLFTISYVYNAGDYLVTKTIRHELNSQTLTLAYAYSLAGDLLTVTRTLAMV